MSETVSVLLPFASSLYLLAFVLNDHDVFIETFYALCIEMQLMYCCAFAAVTAQAAGKRETE